MRRSYFGVALTLVMWAQAAISAEAVSAKCNACGTVIALKVEQNPAPGCVTTVVTQTRNRPLSPDAAAAKAYWREASSISGQVEAAQTREEGFTWRFDPNEPELSGTGSSPKPAEPAASSPKAASQNSSGAKGCTGSEKRYGVVTSIDGGQATDWFSTPQSFKVGDKVQIVGGLLKLRASGSSK